MTPLKKFGLILSYFQCVIYTVMITYCIIRNLDSTDDNYATDKSNYTETTTEGNVRTNRVFFQTWLIIIFLALSILCLLSTISMLYGINFNREEFITPWIIVHSFAAVIIFGVNVYDKYEETFFVVYFVMTIFYTGLHCFVIYIVYLLYEEIEESNT